MLILVINFRLLENVTNLDVVVEQYASYSNETQ